MPSTDVIQCSNPDCTLATGGRCARAAEFDEPLEDCPDLHRPDEDEAAAAENNADGAEGETATEEQSAPRPASAPPRPSDNADHSTPWAGEALRAAEYFDLLQKSHPIVIAVAGPHNAGKTCLLTSLFLQIANGQIADFPYRFASSRSLLGFGKLVERANCWTGGAGQIVGHTPKNDSGSFLHLGLRPSRPNDERHVDVLLSDFPGEWFKNWATRPADEKGVQFMNRAAAVLVVADAHEMMNNRRYEAEISRLVRRIVEQKKRVALLYSKIDKLAEPATAAPLADKGAWGEQGRLCSRTWNAIGVARKSGCWGAVFNVSAFPKPMAEGQPRGVLALFAAALAMVDTSTRWKPPAPAVAQDAKGLYAMRLPGEHQR